MDSNGLWRLFDVICCNLFGPSFVGACGVKEVLWKGKQLRRAGFEVTYNLLGEHVTNPGAVDAALVATAELIHSIQPENSGNVSCKPTLYGLCVSKETFRENIRKLADIAIQKGVEIEIDAESSRYIPDTFEIFSSLCRTGYSPVLRQAVQSHLKDIFLLMDEYKLWDKNLRIVKGTGVYDENESVAVESDKEFIGAKYLEIMDRNIGNGKKPFVATVRDRKLAELIIRAAQKGQFEFQMLYGPLGRKLSKNLVRRGYPVRIYMPFSDTWCPDAWKPFGLRRMQMMRRLMLSAIMA
ncbi:MAG: proline dehydrogenase family protein [Candidatus Yanofskybacteria bacterium]|nr:proline dehydrogenase family protein [Candidatus Yanofskybacteria bacterium]